MNPLFFTSFQITIKHAVWKNKVRVWTGYDCSMVCLHLPSRALFDFHGDSNGDSSTEKHLSVRKGQFLTVVDFAATSGDWVVAYSQDGQRGILPFCFAQYCDPFPGKEPRDGLILFLTNPSLCLSWKCLVFVWCRPCASVG